ncbi:MAG: hypothetical protein I4N51_14740 [Acinetobacter sp.]|nr:hypothetical protein [Acinetobacter sp.]
MSEFKSFEASEVINQINTGISHIGSPFIITEPTKDFTKGAIDLVKKHFKDTDVDIDVVDQNGETTITAVKK